jgi:hypothetical protein
VFTFLVDGCRGCGAGRVPTVVDVVVIAESEPSWSLFLAELERGEEKGAIVVSRWGGVS